MTAVHDLSFTISGGEVFGLVGESGSGKSLTALAIIGLQSLQAKVSGGIRFCNEKFTVDVTSASEEQMRSLRGSAIAMIFQEPMTALNPVMRVGDQIAEAVLAHKPIGRSAAAAQAVAAMREVAIPEPERRARD